MSLFAPLTRGLQSLCRAAFRRSIVSFSKDGQDGLRKVARLLSKRRWQLSFLIFTAFLAAAFEGGTMGLLGLAVSVLVGDTKISTGLIGGHLGTLFDQFISSTSTGGLFLLLVGLAVCAQLLKSILLYVSQVLEIYLSFGMKRQIQRETVGYLMSMTYSRVAKYSAGEVAHIVDQSDVVMDGVAAFANIARATLMLIACVAVMFAMSVKMTLATILVAGLLWFSLNRVVSILRDLGSKTVDAKLELWRWTVEFLSAPRLLRLFNATDHARDVVNQARDQEIFTERKGEAIQAAIKPAIEAITVFGAGVFLIVGYLAAVEGARSAIPKLFVYVLIFYRLKPHIQAFNDFRVKLARVTKRLELVGGFLRVATQSLSRKGGQSFNNLSKEIKMKDVCFRYPETNVDVLQGITFTIPAGSTTAIVGSSGAGKSTAADLLLGLYEPSSGVIMVDDEKLSDINLADWRDNIGVVDQNVFLLNTTIAENIRFARERASFQDIENAARLAHVHEFVCALQDGYDTAIGDRGYRLSGGQQQRIALARALVRNPTILILDEATSALDTISERHIQDALEAMHNTRTVVIIAHRLSTVAKADHIIVLDKGRIVEQGTRQELLKDAGQFAKLWHLQVGSAA